MQFSKPEMRILLPDLKNTIPDDIEILSGFSNTNAATLFMKTAGSNDGSEMRIIKLMLVNNEWKVWRISNLDPLSNPELCMALPEIMSARFLKRHSDSNEPFLSVQTACLFGSESFFDPIYDIWLVMFEFAGS